MSAVRVPVLMYHRVGDARNEWEARYCIHPRVFASHMRALADQGYMAMSIDLLADWMEGNGDLPDRAFLLTFDDGFLGVHDHAWPVLRDFGWPFTVFIVSNLIGGTDEWTRSANPSGMTYPLLEASHIRAMQALGVSFQSHSQTHPSLPRTGDEQLGEELAGSRAALSELLGTDVMYFAYPYGHLDERVEAQVRAAGYRAAFSTQPGFNRRDVNPFRIRRLDVFGTDTPAMLMRKVHLACNDGSLGYTLRYYIKRGINRIVGMKS